MSEPFNSESVPVDFEGDAFDDWIAGATIAKRSVAIYGNPGLRKEQDKLERDLEIADAQEKHGSEAAGSESSRILEQMEELYAKWMASKSEWTVRALNEDDFDAIKADMAESGLVEPEPLPEPVEPLPLAAKATDQQGKNHTIAVQKYEKDKAEYDAAFPAYDKAVIDHANELNLRMIARAVERIEFTDGRASDSISVDRLRVLKRRLGEKQLLNLLQAAQLAMFQEPEIPAPFYRRTSEDDQT